MLVLTLERHPGGDRRRTVHLGTTYIQNVTDADSPPTSDYYVRVCTSFAARCGATRMGGTVLGYDRSNPQVWRLVQRSLDAVLGRSVPPGDESRASAIEDAARSLLVALEQFRQGEPAPVYSKARELARLLDHPHTMNTETKNDEPR